MLRSLILRTFITSFGIAAVTLVNSVLLSRWLGPSGRGEVAAAMLWPTLLIYLSNTGLIASVLYHAALPESKPSAIFANAVVIGCGQSLVAVMVGYVALPLLLASQRPGVIGAGSLYLLIIPFGLITQYGVSILQGRMRISTFNWLRAVIPFGYLLGTIALVMLGQLELLNIILLQLALQLATLALTLAALLKLNIRVGFWPDIPLAKRMLKYGAKVHIGNISGIANLSLDQVLMAALLPPAYLGLYVVAVSSASLLQVLSQAVQMVLTPSIAQQVSASQKATILRTVFRRYWLLSSVATLAISVILPPMIPIIFGRDFNGAVLPAEVLLLGMLFIGAKEVLAGGAQALGDPWSGSQAHLWALVVTVILLYLLLPSWGIMGAAVATTTAYATQLVVMTYRLRRLHGISPVDLFRIEPRDVSAVLAMFANLIRPPKAAITG